MNKTNNPTEKELTGYPSIDKPWLKYYSEEQRNAPKPADMSIYQRIKENIDEYKHLYAIRFEGNRITYAEMIDSIDKTANALKTIGVKENDIVVCYMPSLPHEVYMLYSCSKIGALINFVKPMTSTEQVCAIINEFKASLFVTFEMSENDRKYIIDNSCVKNIVNISMCESCENGIHWNDFIGRATVKAEHTTKSNDEGFFIAHTGGSTGKSKAVVISNNALNIQTTYFYLCEKYSSYRRSELEKTETLEQQWLFLKQKLIEACDIPKIGYKLDLADEKRIGKAKVACPITTKEQAFSHLDEIKPSCDNAFLFNKQNHF